MISHLKPREYSECLFVERLKSFASAEEKRDTPNTGKCYDRVDYTADKCCLTAAEPSDYVEFEKTDATPVERSDNCEDKSNSIHYHNNIDRTFRLYTVFPIQRFYF